MDSTESKELKLLFIQEELSQHGEWLCDEFTEAIERKKLKKTEDLYDSINYDSFMDGDDVGLRVSFFSYGRAFEIAGSRKNKKNKWAVNTNRDIWGIKQNKSKVKKNTQWYARNMYGGLNRLISKVMYGLSDVEIARLKNIIEERKNSLQNGRN